METLNFITDCLAQTHLRLMATCDGLTAEQMAWRPAPAANNIGFILWHVCRNEDSRVTRTAGEQSKFASDLWVTDGWHRSFNQPITAPDPGDRLGLRSLAIPPPDVLLAYAETVNRRTMQFLASLDPPALDAPIGPPEPGQTTAGSLRHIIVHKNNHHGQIDYLRGLQQEDWDLPRGMGARLRP